MQLLIHRAGFLTAIQDSGRTGYRKFGVSQGGALDSHALRVANLLVGNEGGAGGLEITFGGLRMQFADDRIIAWCGGKFDVRVGSGSVAAGHSVLVRKDEEIVIGPPSLGCRAWLAISGGIDVPRTLGSRSTDWRARFGGVEGRALRDGDRIPLGKLSDLSRSIVDLLAADRLSSWTPTTEWIDTADSDPLLRVVRGAHWGLFDNWSHAALLREPFIVTRDSNRMGVRLEGSALKRTDGPSDLISEAVAPGTIQVPPDGQPIILLEDCQTIGGYPKIAHVITVDLSLAAQLHAGNKVSFREVSMADALRLLFERERDYNFFRTGLSLQVS